MRALRHPPLGLVLALGAMVSLPSQVHTLVTLIMIDGGSLGGELWSMQLAMLATGVLQLVTGIVMMGQRRAEIPFYVYLVSCVALVAIATYVMRDEGQKIIAGVALEALGPPLVVLVGSSFMNLRATRRRGDAGVLMILHAVTLFLAIPHEIIATARMLLAADRPGLGAWVGLLIHPVIGLGLAAVTLAAGLALVRGPGDLARAKLRVFLVVTVFVRVALAIVSVVGFFVVDEVPLYVVVIQVVSGALALVSPLLVWSYASRVIDDDASDDLTAAPSWVLLVFVPPLLGRLAIASQLMTEINAVFVVVALGICVVQAALHLWAARAALVGARTDGRFVAAGGFVLYIAFVIVAYKTVRDVGRMQPVGAAAMLAASTAVFAWLVRRRP